MSENIIVLLITKLFEMFGKFLDWIFGRNKTKNTKEKGKANSQPEDISLTSHYVFTRMNEIINHINFYFYIPNKAKEMVFKTILSKVMVIFENKLEEIANIVDKTPEMSDGDLKQLHIEAFNECLDAYSNFYLSSDYSLEDRTVLSIVMPKFNKWNYARIEYTPETIDRICHCIFYGNAKVKCSVIFDYYTSFFADMILDADSTLAELNGDLKTLSFKGYKF